MTANLTTHATIPNHDRRAIPSDGSYAATIVAALPTTEGQYPAYELWLLFRHPATHELHYANVAIILHPAYMLGVAKLVARLNPAAAGLPLGPDPTPLGLVDCACIVTVRGGETLTLDAVPDADDPQRPA